jgi:prevent-host-death family protein
MEKSHYTSVGAYEAKSRFSELLQLVAKGEEVTITRHGMAVARLVPVQAAPSADSRREAIAAMRQLAAQNRLKGLKVADLRAEGRR